MSTYLASTPVWFPLTEKVRGLHNKKVYLIDGHSPGRPVSLCVIEQSPNHPDFGQCAVVVVSQNQTDRPISQILKDPGTYLTQKAVNLIQPNTQFLNFAEYKLMIPSH